MEFNDGFKILAQTKVKPTEFWQNKTQIFLPVNSNSEIPTEATDFFFAA